MDFTFPFEKSSYSFSSVIFRHSAVLDNYQNTIGWEQFFDGSAKFHVPLPYLDEDYCKTIVKEHANNFSKEEVFNDFEYVDGKVLTSILFGTLSTYFRTMLSVNPYFEDVIIAFELENVRKDVLFFETPHYYKLLKEQGLIFSDRNYYFINNGFRSKKINIDNSIELLKYFMVVFNAFGYSAIKGTDLFINSSIQGK